MAQFVYLDESGDTGFKFEKGSSRYFVVTLLITDDPVPLHSAVDGLRVQLGYRSDSEFKFYRSTPDARRRFLRTVCQESFVFRALVVDKHLMTRPHMRHRETFYNYLVKMVLRHDGGRLDDAMLILDQREKGRQSKQSTSTYLRRELNAGTADRRRIKEIRYHESHRDNLLQVADMLAGAINHRFAHGDDQYARLITRRMDDLWVWRPSSDT